MKHARRITIQVLISLLSITTLLTGNATATAATPKESVHITNFTDAKELAAVCKTNSKTSGLYQYGSGKPFNGTYVPIVLIHGWSAPGESWDGNVNLTTTPEDQTAYDSGVYESGTLPQMLREIPGAAVFGFRYYDTSFKWITNKNNGPKLATALNCLKQATGQKAIVVVHSMGGLLTHYALNNGAEDTVSRVITYATPNTGSKLAALAAQTISHAIDSGVDALASKLTKLPIKTRMIVNMFTDCGKTATGACTASRLLYTNLFTTNYTGDPYDVAAMGLAYNSGPIRELEEKWPWPSNVTVNAYGGNTNINLLGMGIFKFKDADSQDFPVGDEIVTPDSARAGSTTYMQENCNYRMEYHVFGDWESGKEQTGALPQTYDENFKKYDQAGSDQDGWEPTAEEKARKYAVWNSGCLHTNITRNTAVVNNSLGYIRQQVQEQQMQFSTYDPAKPADPSKWTIGYDGVGPYKISMTTAEVAAMEKKLFGGDNTKYYRADVKAAVERAYRTGTNLVTEPGWAGYANGRMLTCTNIAENYNGVRSFMYTPIGNASNADDYIKTTDAYNKTTLDQIVIADGQTSFTPPIATPAGIKMGSRLEVLYQTYGKKKLITVDGQKVYQLQNPSNPGYWGDQAARSEDENYSSINFFLNDNAEVSAITLGKLLPNLPRYGPCQKEITTDTGDVKATYDRSNPTDISRWTVGFDGLGPVKLSGATAAGLSKTLGVDFGAQIKGYATASHAMDKGVPGAVQDGWGGLSFCAAATRDGHIGAIIQTPRGRAKTYQAYVDKYNPDETSKVEGIWSSTNVTYLSPGMPDAKYFYDQLPTTRQGTGYHGSIAQIKQEFGSARVQDQTYEGEGVVLVFPTPELKTQWLNAGEGNTVQTNMIVFQVSGYAIEGLGAYSNASYGCAN